MHKRLIPLISAAMAVAVGCSSDSPTAPAGDDGTTAKVVSTAAPGGVSMAPAEDNFIAILSNDDAGTDSPGRGVARFKISEDGQSVDFQLIVANIRNVTMAHIHISDVPGGSGPPAVWLYPSAPPQQEIPGRFQGVLASGGFDAGDFVGPLDGMTVQDLVTRITTGRAYVNVHTTQNPPGEIRGQVR